MHLSMPVSSSIKNTELASLSVSSHAESMMSCKKVSRSTERLRWRLMSTNLLSFCMRSIGPVYIMVKAANQELNKIIAQLDRLYSNR